MNDLFDLLEFESKEISHFFKKASVEGKGTPQEVSDRREAAVTIFLRKFFPFPYQIAKGNVIDSFGLRSASIDCLLLNPAHPHTIGGESKYSMIFADGVDVAIEVKPNLNSETEIVRGLAQLRSVKQLRRVESSVWGEEVGLTAPSQSMYRIPAMLFSTETYTEIRLLIEKIVSYYETHAIPRIEQFDMIVINERCCIFNFYKGSYFNNGIEGIAYIENGVKSLSTFLYCLNTLPRSEIQLRSSVISHYIPWDINMLRTHPDLNLRLSNIRET